MAATVEQASSGLPSGKHVRGIDDMLAHPAVRDQHTTTIIDPKIPAADADLVEPTHLPVSDPRPLPRYRKGARGRRGLPLSGTTCATSVSLERCNTAADVANKHRTRNSVTAISASGGPYCAALFYLKILTKPSISSRLVSCAATGLGSKMVARRSIFVP